MKTNVVAFEGLHPLIFPKATWLQKGVLARLGKSHFNVSVYHWMSKGPKSFQYTGPIIAIGHSMGGGAVIDWCERYGKTIDLMLTLDPRVTGSKPYEKPSNVKRAVNFYQKGFMPGYEVKGADNRKVTCGHTQIPSLTEVFTTVMGG
jgi:hypothetical protein